MAYPSFHISIVKYKPLQTGSQGGLCECHIIVIFLSEFYLWNMEKKGKEGKKEGRQQARPSAQYYLIHFVPL